jgi:hypothetical protein
MISCIFTALSIRTIWASNICSLIALLAFNNIELDTFPILNTPKILSWVVPYNCCIVHEHIFICVVTVYKPIATLNVKPQDCSCHMAIFYLRSVVGQSFVHAGGHYFGGGEYALSLNVPCTPTDNTDGLTLLVVWKELLKRNFFCRYR